MFCKTFASLRHGHNFIGHNTKATSIIIVTHCAANHEQLVFLNNIGKLRKHPPKHRHFGAPCFVVNRHKGHAVATALTTSNTQCHHQASYQCCLPFTCGG